MFNTRFSHSLRELGMYDMTTENDSRNREHIRHHEAFWWEKDGVHFRIYVSDEIWGMVDVEQAGSVDILDMLLEPVDGKR